MRDNWRSAPDAVVAAVGSATAVGMSPVTVTVAVAVAVAVSVAASASAAGIVPLPCRNNGAVMVSAAGCPAHSVSVAPTGSQPGARAGFSRTAAVFSASVERALSASERTPVMLWSMRPVKYPSVKPPRENRGGKKSELLPVGGTPFVRRRRNMPVTPPT